ncbi:MAG: AbrB/MazE/SpoVT family DNA-binding domain-containing protein [Bacteroidota bacterium]
MSATTTIKLRKVGNSIGATFPKEILDRLGLEEKSEMIIVETEDGFTLKRYDSDFEAAMEAYHEVAKQYENALRELAK